MIHLIHIVPSTSTINYVKMHHPHILLLSLASISFTVLARQPDEISLVAPVTQDTKTSLHSVTLNNAGRYVINLDAPFSWRYCQFPHSLISCSSPQCYAARSYVSPKRPLLKNKPRYGKCNSVVTPTNPIAKECALANLASSYLIMSMTNGINPTDTTNFGSFPISCAPQNLLHSLPKDAVRVEKTLDAHGTSRRLYLYPIREWYFRIGPITILRFYLKFYFITAYSTIHMMFHEYPIISLWGCWPLILRFLLPSQHSSMLPTEK